MRRLGYVPALDGLRGIAILLVIGFHYLNGGWLSGGSRGVDLFFVLSGFLITSLLLEERAARGTVRLRAFYVRRARRLFPALVVLLLVLLAVDAARGVDGLPAVAEYGLYGGNVYAAYFVPAHPFVGISHLWSLAQEEQFYVIWPALLLVVARWQKAASWILAAALLLALYRAGTALSGDVSNRLYDSPEMHSDGLLLGAAAAFWRFQGGRVGERTAKASFLFAAFCVVFFAGTTGVYEWQLLAFEVAAVGMVLAAVSDTSFAQALAARPLVAIGKISYSLYLWHFFTLWALGGHNRLLALAIAVICAVASYRWVETPFRRRRPRSRTELVVQPAG
jgi:peptidoglycan/LPS O-acetylase OafA/YrhL